MAPEATSSDQSIRVTATAEGAVAHQLAVSVDAARVKKAFDRAYRDLAKNARLPGFRPGKVPRSVLERRFGASIAEQLEGSLVAETLADAIELAGLEPVTEPAIEAETPSPDAEFRYTARVEVKPAFDLPDLEGLPAKRPPVEVPGQDVEAELESLRQRSAPLLEEPEGTEIAAGHVVSVDFVGRIDDKPFPGGTGRGVEVEIGAARFLPGFEDQLVGARSGDDREVSVRFPDDYGNAGLAGKQAVFAVHVAAVRRRQVPELDDEFAKDLGDFDSLEALRERIRTDLFTSRERASREVLHRTVVDSLIERTPFEVPAGMIERHLERQVHAARHRLEGQVPEAELHRQLVRWREEWRAGSEREVRQRLLLEAIARERELSADDDDVDARLAEMAGEQGVEPGQLQNLYGDGLRDALRAQLVEEKVLDLLAGGAKVEETTDT
jgi:trigger factor